MNISSKIALFENIMKDHTNTKYSNIVHFELVYQISKVFFSYKLRMQCNFELQILALYLLLQVVQSFHIFLIGGKMHRFFQNSKSKLTLCALVEKDTQIQYVWHDQNQCTMVLIV